MNIRFLETLIWLNRLKSFSRTADKLNTTQPAVSSRIHKLEETLNIRLFDRNTKSFELTPAGRRVLLLAEQIVSLSGELQKMANGDEDPSGLIRVGIIEVVTLTWFPTMLDMLTTEFPKRVIEFTTGTSSFLINELKRDALDLVFVIGPVNEPNISNIPVSSFAVEWLANPQKFDCTTPMDVIELSRLPVMIGREKSSGREQIIEYFHRYGIVDIPSRGYNIRLDLVLSLSTAAHVVRAGLGVAALPMCIVTPELQDGSIAKLNVRQRLAPFDITACVKEAQLSSPLVANVLRSAIAAAEIHSKLSA